MRKPVLWLVARDRRGKPWQVFAATRGCCLALRDWRGGGPAFGIVFRDKRRRVYIDVARPLDDVLETLLHELKHIASARMDLPSKWEEDIVTAESEELYPLLKSAGVVFPPLPPEAAACLKRPRKKAA
jgi:hypothetical protein